MMRSGSKAEDAVLFLARPRVAPVFAPVEPVARRLIFVKVSVVIVIANGNQPPVVEIAQAWRDQPLVAGGQVGFVDLPMLEPRVSAIIAGQNGQNLIFLRPVSIGITVD